jgi:membrane associated rhomboid family serine protease
MTVAPVGIRCPDHAGKPASAPAKMRQTARRASYEGSGAVVTKILVAVNVGIYFLELALGGTWNGQNNRIYEHGALYGPLVADGEWWRLITAAFLHGSLLHLAFNMLFLWWFGRNLEAFLGPARYVGIYFVSALAGSAGALLVAPDVPTVGASGAVFGILGAGLVLERGKGIAVFGGQALFVVVLNLALAFVLSNVSIGGHIGGLVGGALSMLALEHFGRQRPFLSREGAAGLAALVALGVVSILIAYAKVRGLA